MRHPTPTAYFWTVLRPAAAMTGAAAAVAIAGIAQVWTDPRGFDEIVALALLCQMFMASSGYQERAVRGHFDPILVGSPDRAAIARAHWLASTAPGLPMWVIAAAVDVIARPGHWPTALTPAGIVAFLYVSTVCWAGTIRFGRYVAGTVWFAAMFAVGVSHEIYALRAWYLLGDGTWIRSLSATGAVLVFPVFLVITPALADWRVLGLVLGAALVIGAGGIWEVLRVDAALAELC
jgi:hypothetical protein